MDKLVADTTIEFYDHPLDYETINNNHFYRDPELDPSIPFTHQYCVVPINQLNLPPYANTVLAELYLPNEHGEDPNIEALVDEALRITNNLDSNGLRQAKGREKYNPEGKIQAYDNIVGKQIPLQYVEVRANRWFETRTAITDASGYFKISEQFKRDVNYSIKWERNEFKIREERWAQAFFNGPKTKDYWNLEIGSSGSEDRSVKYSAIHRAAARYYYGDIGGLKRIGNSDRLIFAYWHYEKGTGKNYTNSVQPLPNIKIWGIKKENNFYEINQILATTFHELGHSSHIKRMGGLTVFMNVTRQIQESWADAIEWYLTELEYTQLGEPGKADDYQYWDLTDNKTRYTPMFIDLADDYDQSKQNKYETLTFPSNRCPEGGTFDGQNCFIASAPTGTNAFHNEQYFLNTPLTGGACPYPNSISTSQGCRVFEISQYAIPFIYNNGWYYSSVGDLNRPPDEVSFYDLPRIEDKVIPNAFGITSLKSQLKQHKPSYVTDKRIDILMDWYGNVN